MMELLARIRAVLRRVPEERGEAPISVGNIVIQGVINAFGSGVIAGYSAAVKLNNLVITSLLTLGNGISNYAAQNLGGGKPERIRAGFRAGLKLVWLLCIPFTAAYVFLGRYLVYIFLDDGAGQAMATGTAFLKIVAPFYFVVAAKLVSDGVLRGMGRMKQFMAGTFADLILRVVLSMVLSQMVGPVGIWMSWPIGWVVSAGMSLVFYRRIWQKNQVVSV